MTGRRGFAVTLTAWVAAAVMTLWSAARVWGSATTRAENDVVVHAQVTGHDVAGALAPCAAALLALALFVFAARGWLRRLTGLLAAGLGVAVVAAALTGRQHVASALADNAFGVQSTNLHASANGWPWIAVVAGAVVTGCGLVVAVVGPRWSGLGRRYDAPSSETVEANDDASSWAALDRGEDPTA
jgi:Tryptophan-associated transmembrane protein (Trp_oprn_chp)